MTAVESRQLSVAEDVAALVAPVSFVVSGLRVVARETRLDRPLSRAAEALRGSASLDDRVAAVRAMYKRTGVDPTKTRPSSEALLRRVRKGGELPRISGVVDVINWCSLESQLPFGLYDDDQLSGAVVLRLGRAGEAYAGIRKDTVHLDGRLTLADETGPFGNPTSDSARSMVTESATRVFVVIFAPTGVPASEVNAVASLTRERLDQYCRPSSELRADN